MDEKEVHGSLVFGSLCVTLSLFKCSSILFLDVCKVFLCKSWDGGAL